jgi:hypothetical protein
MSIELLQTMQWSQLCWDRSFDKFIELDIILPKIGAVYPVKLQRNESFSKEGNAFILWKPPHSELNGWDDKRPTEILKSYVLEGIIKNSSASGLDFDFEVVNRFRFQDLFSKVTEDEKSPLSEIGQPDGSSLIQWQDARGVLKAKIDDFWYLSGSECETSLEVIFSYEKETICLHYSATLHHPAFYETKITKYYLNDVEYKLFKQLISHADEITDNSISELQENQIYGAEYW